MKKASEKYECTVFKIQCNNGKFYIDCSRNVQVRWNSHKRKLKCGYHPSSEMQADWNRLGHDAFSVNVLWTDTVAVRVMNRQRKLYRKDFQPEYNATWCSKRFLIERATEIAREDSETSDTPLREMPAGVLDVLTRKVLVHQSSPDFMWLESWATLWWPEILAWHADQDVSYM